MRTKATAAPILPPADRTVIACVADHLPLTWPPDLLTSCLSLAFVPLSLLFLLRSLDLIWAFGFYSLGIEKDFHPGIVFGLGTFKFADRVCWPVGEQVFCESLCHILTLCFAVFSSHRLLAADLTSHLFCHPQPRLDASRHHLPCPSSATCLPRWANALHIHYLLFCSINVSVQSWFCTGKWWKVNSIYQLIHVPTLTCGHELWVLTKRMRLQIQEARMSFLHRVTRLRQRYRTEIGQTERVWSTTASVSQTNNPAVTPTSTHNWPGLLWSERWESCFAFMLIKDQFCPFCCEQMGETPRTVEISAPY